VSSLSRLASRIAEVFAQGGLGALIGKGYARLQWRRVGVPLFQPEPAAEAAFVYGRWLQRHAPRSGQLLALAEDCGALPNRPKISLVAAVPDADGDAWRSILDSLIAQAYPEWEFCVLAAAPESPGALRDVSEKDARVRPLAFPKSRSAVEAANAALKAATGDFVGWIDPGDRLYPDALAHIARAISADPSADLLYTDEDRIAPSGERVEPFFKPDWSPTLLDSLNYVGRFAVLRRRLAIADGGFREGSDGSPEDDWLHRASAQARRIAHIPRILYGKRLRPAPATPVTPKPSRDIRTDPVPRVSIIIPTCGDPRLLGPCLEGVERTPRSSEIEVILLDNGDGDLRSRLEHGLDKLRHEIVKDARAFNFSEFNNEGASRASGELLLFLNDDTAPVNPEWLDALRELAWRPEVGAVGAKLLYPDGTLQHAGMVLGVGGPVGHVFRGLPGDAPGHGGLAGVTRDVSAVTGACLMMRRELFRELGGWDPAFRLDFGDADLCLRARARGYRVVWTPRAVLTHRESATRGRVHSAEDSLKFFKRWGEAVRAGDPYYNPNLSRTMPGYGLDL